MTKIGAVLGWPITHSRSPAMHEAAFRALEIDARFVALAVPPPSLADAVMGLAAGRFLGASVTVPHKEAVVALCDRVEPPADRIGAVNCLVFEDGAIVGHNTDAGGFVDSLREAQVPLRGRALLLGAGGAARAVAAGLEDAGVTDISIYARDPRKWPRAIAWSRDLGGHDLIVDCTPAALHPDTDEVFMKTIDPDTLAPGATVVSLVYHRRSLLLEAAAARGLATVDGKGMLVHQGARAFALWLGREAPVDAMRAAL